MTKLSLRDHAKQTSLRLVIGFGVLLLFVGGGLIYLFYGPSAAFSGVLCILVGTFPIILIWVILMIIERTVKRINEE